MPKPKGKAEPCPKPQKQDSPIKVEPKSPPKMDNRQLSTETISDDHSLSSHSCDLLNTSIVSSSVDDANEYEEFPPTQLSKKGDVFSSRAEGQDAYREAAFAAPPSEEGAANNQVFEGMPNPFTGPKEETSVCYMCDEVIPRKRDTIALQPVSCDACMLCLPLYQWTFACQVDSSASAWLMDLRKLHHEPVVLPYLWLCVVATW